MHTLHDESLLFQPLVGWGYPSSYQASGTSPLEWSLVVKVCQCPVVWVCIGTSFVVNPTLEVNECTLTLPAHPKEVGNQELLTSGLCV